jgi:nucleotide-binding universal stress UspA family protein
MGGSTVFPIRTILHPTDYSERSRPAFDLSCALARDFGAELIVCHVSPPPIIAAGEGVIVDFPTGETEEMMARLKDVKPEKPGVRVTHQLLRGEPASEIAQLAAKAKVDLIVVGTHGRGGLSRLLMGSVAEGVMRKAPCPVVTVKAPFPAEPVSTAVNAGKKAASKKS